MILKSLLYENEQNKIVNKIINILQLDSNNSITLYKLDNDINKQNQISNLIPEIRKYFKCNCIVGVLHPEKVQRPWLSILKHILKIKYKIIINDIQFTIKETNNSKIKIRTKNYKLEKLIKI